MENDPSAVTLTHLVEIGGPWEGVLQVSNCKSSDI